MTCGSSCFHQSSNLILRDKRQNKFPPKKLTPKVFAAQFLLYLCHSLYHHCNRVLCLLTVHFTYGSVKTTITTLQEHYRVRIKNRKKCVSQNASPSNLPCTEPDPGKSFTKENMVLLCKS